MRKSFTAPLLLMAMLACQTTPEGFTPEAWERLQRDQPNKAQVVGWVHKDAKRKELLRIWNSCNDRKDEFYSDLFYDTAEPAMIAGHGDLKPITVSAINEIINSVTRYSESNTNTLKDRDNARKHLALLRKALIDAESV